MRILAVALALCVPLVLPTAAANHDLCVDGAPPCVTTRSYNGSRAGPCDGSNAAYRQVWAFTGPTPAGNVTFIVHSFCQDATLWDIQDLAVAVRVEDSPAGDALVNVAWEYQSDSRGTVCTMGAHAGADATDPVEPSVDCLFGGPPALPALP